MPYALPALWEVVVVQQGIARIVAVHADQTLEEIAQGLTPGNARRIVECIHACQYMKPVSIPHLLNLLRDFVATVGEIRVRRVEPKLAPTVERLKRIKDKARKALEGSFDLS